MMDLDQLKKKDNNGILNYLNQDYLFKSSLFNFFIYRPVRTIVNHKVIKVGINNIITLLENLFFLNFFLDILQETIFIIFIGVVFIFGVKKQYKKIYRLKNIFKICN